MASNRLVERTHRDVGVGSVIVTYVKLSTFIIRNVIPTILLLVTVPCRVFMKSERGGICGARNSYNPRSSTLVMNWGCSTGEKHLASAATAIISSEHASIGPRESHPNILRSSSAWLCRVLCLSSSLTVHMHTCA